MKLAVALFWTIVGAVAVIAYASYETLRKIDQ